jgi:hypothetical protein
MADPQTTAEREYTREEMREACRNNYNAAIDEIDLQLRSKCPSLDENGYIVEMKNVIAIVRGCKRS